jgi:hypothetical protein
MPGQAKDERAFPTAVFALLGHAPGGEASLCSGSGCSTGGRGGYGCRSVGHERPLSRARWGERPRWWQALSRGLGSGARRRGTRLGNRFNRGYATFSYHVTDGHEAQAVEAEREKRPNRVGVLVLRLLGYRGPIEQPHQPKARHRG